MKTQYDWDRFFLQFAGECAKLSYDPKQKVGAVVVRQGNILSFSYNGTVPGWDNTTRDPNGRTFSGVIHAEAHAISKVARSNESTEGATIYCTLTPCIECSKLIVTSGISRVVFSNHYKCLDGLEFLIKAKVETLYYAPDDTVICYYQPSHEDFANKQWVLNSTGLSDGVLSNLSPDLYAMGKLVPYTGDLPIKT